MKNMKVSLKLVVSFSIIIVLTLTIGAIGIIGMNNINNSFDEMYELQTAPLPELGKAIEMLQRQRACMRELIIGAAVGDMDLVTDANARANEYRETMYPALDAYFASIRSEEAIRLFTEARNLYDTEFRECFDRIYQGARDGVPAMELYTLMREYTPHVNQIVDNFDRCLEMKIDVAAGAAQDASDMGDMLLVIIIVVLVIAVGVAVFLTFNISGLIAKPLSIIAAAFAQIGSQGKLTFDESIKSYANETAKRKDELGACAKGFNGIIEHLQEIESNLAEIANGDLTTEVHALSNEDSIAISMQKTLDNLNTMFSEINTASHQVSTGSKQIADGAQSLAQGSTEQAASVQQLSASIGEVASKTKENAEMADRAATLASTIMQNAERGNTQMGEMTTAVHEINQASQSISKVIKVIDDIAFQTNILALNAAVEAARAGQHGKGFAVVAEEVRNLAAKSAEAAKDTGGLIQNSMEKAELGARIAGETAESLADIVSGISESSQIVGEIARSSEEQTIGITQINTGIDQVAQVVQQNSATAQESAAASEQMSSQSSMLEDLISQFKLKDQSFNQHSLPAKKPKAAEAPAPSAAEDVYEPHGMDDFGKY